jgi:hypothetical protein
VGDVAGGEPGDGVEDVEWYSQLLSNTDLWQQQQQQQQQ